MAKRLRVDHEVVHHLEQAERALAEVLEELKTDAKPNLHALRRKLEVYAKNPVTVALDGITSRSSDG